MRNKTYRDEFTIGTVIFDAFSIVAQGTTEEPVVSQYRCVRMKPCAEPGLRSTK